MLLNTTGPNEEISREMIKYFVLNENKNIGYQNSSDVAKAMLRGKCIAFI